MGLANGAGRNLTRADSLAEFILLSAKTIFETRHRALIVCTVANSAEGKFKLIVFQFASPFYHDVGGLRMLPPIP